MVGGIFLGLIATAAFVAFASKLGGSYATIAAYAWPALFLSLGWNFLDYGLDPPGPDDGLVWGWLVCAVIFFLMGGLPLLALFSPKIAAEDLVAARPGPARCCLGRWAAGGNPAGCLARDRSQVAAARLSAALRRQRPRRGARPTVAPPAGGDVVAQLERLAALRDRGAIDADEYERAKKAVLDE